MGSGEGPVHTVVDRFVADESINLWHVLLHVTIAMQWC
jgi:hypothetical protein